MLPESWIAFSLAGPPLYLHPPFLILCCGMIILTWSMTWFVANLPILLRRGNRNLKLAERVLAIASGSFIGFLLLVLAATHDAVPKWVYRADLVLFLWRFSFAYLLGLAVLVMLRNRADRNITAQVMIDDDQPDASDTARKPIRILAHEKMWLGGMSVVVFAGFVFLGFFHKMLSMLQHYWPVFVLIVPLAIAGCWVWTNLVQRDTEKTGSSRHMTSGIFIQIILFLALLPFGMMILMAHGLKGFFRTDVYSPLSILLAFAAAILAHLVFSQKDLLSRQALRAGRMVGFLVVFAMLLLGMPVLIEIAAMILPGSPSRQEHEAFLSKKYEVSFEESPNILRHKKPWPVPDAPDPTARRALRYLVFGERLSDLLCVDVD